MGSGSAKTWVNPHSDVWIQPLEASAYLSSIPFISAESQMQLWLVYQYKLNPQGPFQGESSLGSFHTANTAQRTDFLCDCCSKLLHTLDRHPAAGWRTSEASTSVQQQAKLFFSRTPWLNIQKSRTVVMPHLTLTVSVCWNDHITFVFCLLLFLYHFFPSWVLNLSICRY